MNKSSHNRNRDMILDIVLCGNQHLTAEQIYLRAKQISPSIVMATVYNNLNRLVDEGQLRRIKAADAVARYDKPTRHDHLCCIKCGRLADIQLEDLRERLCAASEREVLSYDLNLYYICDECRQDDERTQKENGPLSRSPNRDNG